jgi:hypothetical protein
MYRTIGFFKKCCIPIPVPISMQPSFSVLVNGTPCGFFASCRGLRQGDPLFPLLFIIVMDTLSRMLSRASEGDFISGFNVGRISHISICHLFADDTLILCGADSDQLRHLKSVFVLFRAVLGLKINLGKFELVPVGTITNVEDLDTVLGCKVAKFTYDLLGVVVRLFLQRKIYVEWNN